MGIIVNTVNNFGIINNQANIFNTSLEKIFQSNLT